jgi:hypothetical protein
MREKMDEMRREFLRFFEYVSQHLSQDPIRDSDQFKNALVRVRPPQVPIVQAEVTIIKEPKSRRRTSTR